MGRRLLAWLFVSGWLLGASSAQSTLEVDLRDPAEGRYSRHLGAFGNGRFGVPVCGGHDCDGDGQLDTAFASISATAFGRTVAGIVTLVWGDASGFGETLDSQSSNDRILLIGGAQALEVCGSEIWMDDVDGDGAGDLLIGRQNFTPNLALNRRGAGALTILFGGPHLRDLSRNGTFLDLGNLPEGLPHLHLFGSRAYDRLGIWMRTGDVDGDGIADIAVGADEADLPGVINAGEVYLLRGGPHLRETSTIDLETYPPENQGEHLTLITPPNRFPNAHFGGTVQLGDLDGNGRAELMIAAALDRAGAALRFANAPVGTGVAKGGIGRGTTYILWDTWFAPDQWVAGREIAVDGPADGVSRITGGLRNGHLGEELAGGANFDGNGKPDLFLGDLRGFGTNGGSSGLGFVLFDAESIRGRGFNVDDVPSDLRSSLIEGVSLGALSADSAAWGDLDGDGLDDLVITNPHASPNQRISAGSLHILYGQDQGWPEVINLAANRIPETMRTVHLMGALGSRLTDVGDTLGYSIAVADTNGDQLADIITNEMQGNGSRSIDAGNLILYSGRALLPPPNEVPPESLTVRQMEEALTLSWQSRIRLRYQLEASPDLLSWTPVGEPLDGSGQLMEFPLPASQIGNHYRLASRVID